MRRGNRLGVRRGAPGSKIHSRWLGDKGGGNDVSVDHANSADIIEANM
jgi:hypothetical protein